MEAFRDWRWRNGSRKEGMDDEVVAELTTDGIGCGSRNKSRGGIWSLRVVVTAEQERVPSGLASASALALALAVEASMVQRYSVQNLEVQSCAKSLVELEEGRCLSNRELCREASPRITICCLLDRYWTRKNPVLQRRVV
jgi:hypothetical protein